MLSKSRIIARFFTLLHHDTTIHTMIKLDLMRDPLKVWQQLRVEKKTVVQLISLAEVVAWLETFYPIRT